MKGQFMLISSIMVGFIVISAASTISDVQERSFTSDDISNTLEMIKKEASDIDHSEREEVRNFINMVSMTPGYEAETVHWEKQSCFNVTLTSSDEQFRLNCIS